MSRSGQRGAVPMRLLLLLAIPALVALVVAPMTVSSLDQLGEIFDRAGVEAREVRIENLVRLGRLTASNTAINARAPFADNNFGYLQSAVDGLAAADPSVRFAAILDVQSSKVMAKAGSEAAEAAIRKNVIDQRYDGKDVVHLWDEKADLLLVAAKVGDLGSVVIAYDTSGIKQVLETTRREKTRQEGSATRRAAITGVVLLLAGMLAAIGFGLWFSRPISRLVRASNALATGDFSARAERAGPSELRQLASTFNDMAVRLRDSVTERVARAAIERELALARTLQTSMMPPQGRADLPGFELCSWYAPAGSVGGDWLSYYPHPSEKRILILVGDVMGHGVPAAFITAAVKSAAEAAIGRGDYPTPSGLLEVLNGATLAAGSGRLTMSCLVLDIDVKAGTLAFGAGGHPWPIIVRREADGGYRAAGFPVRGSLLGEKQPQYEEQRCKIAKGDLLLLFTDGLSEAINPEEREYGTRRMCKVMERLAGRPLEEIVAAIQKDLEDFTRGHALEDDICVIIGRFLG